MIGKILTEINRLKNELDGYSAKEGLDYIESYINTLSKQQEQPCDTCTNDKGCVTCEDGELWEGKEQPSEDLEKEYEEYVDKDPVFGKLINHFAGITVARHFAEWQKEQMPMPEDTVIFQKGIEEGKRLMMEDAVEASVNYYENIPGGSYVELVADILNPTGVRYKDKVKIIIVKED